MSTGAREQFVDLTRAIALLGIAVVNVSVLAYPATTGYYAGGLATPVDRVAYFLVCALFLFKSYTLFSFMFGVGFAYQMDAASRASASFGARYARRMLGLFVLGVINLTFLFWGDILVIYSLLGSLLFLCRSWPADRLRAWARGMYVVQLLLVALVAAAVWLGATFAPAGIEAEWQKAVAGVADAKKEFDSTSFFAVAASRASIWAENIGIALTLQSFGAFAFLLFGFATVRQGLLSQPEHMFWARCRRVYLPLGLLISAAGALLSASASSGYDPNSMLGLLLITAGSPLATFGFLGAIARWSIGPASALKTFLARAGSASLTAYLLQGLLMSWVFSGYGLGLYADLGAAACTLIAAAVAIATWIFSSRWRRRFERGPVESLLRAWTYLRFG